jgi:predicted nucleotidyltransferase component of viral defense system
MDPSSPYFKQVQLLVNVMPAVARQACFALKGGTAINLFYRDLPRLSVDIDLVYLPQQERPEALAGIDVGLKAIQLELSKRPGYRVSNILLPKGAGDIRIVVETAEATIKIEVNPVLRETVFPTQLRKVSETVEQQFGFGEMAVLDFNEIYAGKLCAALDRQHPRDLFDVRQLLQNEGLNSALKDAFLVYLISHNRPIAEVLSPNLQDIADIYKREFVGMTTAEQVTLEELYLARESLIRQLHAALTTQDKEFLMSFKNRNPDWTLFAHPHVKTFPAVRWKMDNLDNLIKKDPDKHRAAVEKLAQALNQ